MKARRTHLKPLLMTGLAAGTLDGLAAVILYYSRTGNDPMNVFRYIASGVFGSSAFTGGTPMALWGILFHYVIAFGWTVLFFVAASRIARLTKNWFVSGAAYGIIVWLGMNLVVVPLSRGSPTCRHDRLGRYSSRCGRFDRVRRLASGVCRTKVPSRKRTIVL